MEGAVKFVDKSIIPNLPSSVTEKLAKITPLQWDALEAQVSGWRNDHVKGAALAVVKTFRDFSQVSTPGELIVVGMGLSVLGTGVTLFAYVVLKWIIVFLVGDVLFRMIRFCFSLLFILIKASQYVGPAYIGLVVLRSLEESEIENKTNVNTLKVQSFGNRFLALPPPNRKLSPENAITLGSLVMSFFILSPFVEVLALFLPFPILSKCLLGIVIYHPFFTLMPKLFRMVKSRPIFVTISVLFELDVEHIQEVYDNVYKMQEAGIVVPLIRFRSPFSVVSKLQRSGESEEWIGVNTKDATESKTISLRIREVAAKNWDESNEIVVAVKQVPNGGRAVDEKIETLVYSTRIGLEDGVGICDVDIDVPVRAKLDVTLNLEIRGKLTFGSDPVLSTIKIDVQDMFVGTGITKASDLELKGDNGEATVVLDASCKGEIRYM